MKLQKPAYKSRLEELESRFTWVDIHNVYILWWGLFCRGLRITGPYIFVKL